MKARVERQTVGQVFCPICTRIVQARLDLRGRRAKVAEGQRCPHCHASTEVAVIVEVPEAA